MLKNQVINLIESYLISILVGNRLTGNKAPQVGGTFKGYLSPCFILIFMCILFSECQISNKDAELFRYLMVSYGSICDVVRQINDSNAVHLALLLLSFLLHLIVAPYYLISFWGKLRYWCVYQNHINQHLMIICAVFMSNSSYHLGRPQYVCPSVVIKLQITRLELNCNICQNCHLTRELVFPELCRYPSIISFYLYLEKLVPTITD